MRACVGTQCKRAWGPVASVRGDPVQACVREPGVCVRACVGTCCVRAWDPVHAWGSSGHGTHVGTQHMKGAFGVQKVVSEDEVESMYYLPYKPSTEDECGTRAFVGVGCGRGRGCGRKHGSVGVGVRGHVGMGVGIGVEVAVGVGIDMVDVDMGKGGGVEERSGVEQRSEFNIKLNFGT